MEGLKRVLYKHPEMLFFAFFCVSYGIAITSEESKT